MSSDVEIRRLARAVDENTKQLSKLVKGQADMNVHLAAIAKALSNEPDPPIREMNLNPAGDDRFA